MAHLMKEKPRPKAPAERKPPRGSACCGCSYWRGGWLPPVRGNGPAAYRAYLKIRPWPLGGEGGLQYRIEGEAGLPEVAAQDEFYKQPF